MKNDTHECHFASRVRSDERRYNVILYQRFAFLPSDSNQSTEFIELNQSNWSKRAGAVAQLLSAMSFNSSFAINPQFAAILSLQRSINPQFEAINPQFAVTNQSIATNQVTTGNDSIAQMELVPTSVEVAVTTSVTSTANSVPTSAEAPSDIVLSVAPRLSSAPIITKDSEHIFDDMDKARRFMQLYGRYHGFPVHLHSERNGQAGFFACGHRAVRMSKAKDALPSLDTVIIPLIDKKNTAKANVKKTENKRADCHWYSRFNIQADGKVKLTATRGLVHTDHEFHPTSSSIPRVINDYTEVLAEEQHSLESLLKKGVKGDDLLRSILEDTFNVKYDGNVFKSMLRSARTNTKIPDGEDFATLLLIMQERYRLQGDRHVYSINKNDTSINRILFVSKEMQYNFTRNGEVLVMDTTMSTNRFGLPMCIIGGVNEFHQTVIFAVALTSHQNEEAFSWIFVELRRIVGTETWSRIKTIFTDGDRAMNASIRSEMAHVFHLRCVFHLKMNIRDNLLKVIGAEDVESFINDWLQIVCLERDEKKFEEYKKRWLKSIQMPPNTWPTFGRMSEALLFALLIRSQRLESKAHNELKASMPRSKIPFN